MRLNCGLVGLCLRCYIVSGCPLYKRAQFVVPYTEDGDELSVNQSVQILRFPIPVFLTYFASCPPSKMSSAS